MKSEQIEDAETISKLSDDCIAIAEAKSCPSALPFSTVLSDDRLVRHQAAVFMVISDAQSQETFSIPQLEQTRAAPSRLPVTGSWGACPRTHQKRPV